MSYKYLKGVLMLVGLGLGSEAYAGCRPTLFFTTQDVDMTLSKVVVRPDSAVDEVLLREEFVINRVPLAVWCDKGTHYVYGKVPETSTLSVRGDHIYDTNIEGIGIRLKRVLNGEEFKYPHVYELNPKYGQYYALGGGHFVIEIVKTAQNTGSGRLRQGRYSTYYLSEHPDRPILTSHIYGGDSITITTSSCAIQDNKDKAINLPAVNKSAFISKGSTHGTTPFDINIKCVGGKNIQTPDKISLRFDYEAVNGTNNVLKNLADESEKAKGVGVQLVSKYQNSNVVIAKNENIKLGELTSDQEARYNLPLEAKYYQTEATVTAGEVKSMATVTIQYD